MTLYEKHKSWFWDPVELQNQLDQFISQESLQGTENQTLRGFSITSHDGSIDSGLHFRNDLMVPPLGTKHRELYPEIKWDLRVAKELDLYPIFHFDKPTKFCVGIFKDIIDFLTERGINPRRARLSKMSPGDKILRHTDGNQFKIHIPICTSPGVDMVVGKEKFHMEAGHCYMVDVRALHYVYNKSEFDRWHLVINTFDTGNNFSIGGLSDSEFSDIQKKSLIWKDFVEGKITSPEILDI